MKQINDYGVKSLIEGFKVAIKELEKIKEESPSINDWCDGRISGYEEAIRQIEYWSTEVTE